MTRYPFATALFLLAAMSPALAGADEDAAVLAPVHRFVGGMNMGDMKAAAATYAPGASIIDEFPPYHWQGSDAFARWGADFTAVSKASGVTEPVVTLMTPSRVAVTGDHAYAVIPARYAFKQHGHPLQELGTFTFALTKMAAGWRIAAWTWAWRMDLK